MAADPKIKCVAVFGGSGFLGRAIVEHLSAAGIAVRVATRHPDRASQAMAVSDDADPVESLYADVRDEDSLALAIAGCDAVVNAVGLYVESGAETFEAVHELGALNVAHQSAVLGVDRLVLISGIGADQRSSSSYVRARAKGELLVSDVFPHATILRPSVLFGVQDSFLNSLSKITKASPFLPLFGSGATKLQPVFVGDVADAVLRALTLPEATGKTYELGGPGVYSYRGLIEILLARSGARCLLLPVPFAIWDLLASAASLLPRPPLTKAQVTLMRKDNLVSKGAPSLEDLGLVPTPLEKILPDYDF